MYYEHNLSWRLLHRTSALSRCSTHFFYPVQHPLRNFFNLVHCPPLQVTSMRPRVSGCGRPSVQLRLSDPPAAPDGCLLSYIAKRFRRKVLPLRTLSFDNEGAGVQEDVMFTFKEPVDFYELCMTDVWELVVEQAMIIYGEQKNTEWEKTTVERMKKFYYIKEVKVSCNNGKICEKCCLYKENLLLIEDDCMNCKLLNEYFK